MKNNAAETTAPGQAGDRLLTFREAAALLGSTCKTSHVMRSLARQGKIRAVRINERVVRFSEASVRELIAGRAVR